MASPAIAGANIRASREFTSLGLGNISHKERVDSWKESGSEDNMFDLGDKDVEDEHEHERKVTDHELVVNKVPGTSLPVKETERQLSKKEHKKNELEELDAFLADFRVTQKESDDQRK